jgi:tetratricopeptide (TPR) repeat protein
MNPRFNRFFPAFLPILLAVPLAAQTISPNSSTAYPILSVGLGARAIGMGEAFTAVADDYSAVYYNPAGLGQIGQPEITLVHSLYFADGFYDNIGGVYPFGTAGTLALGARYLNYGSIDQRDNFGNLLGSYTPFDVSAEGAFGFPLDRDSFLGFSSQWISQNIDGVIQTGLLWNAGLLLKPFNRFSFGLDLKNLGVDSGGENLPAALLWGMAYRLSLAEEDLQSILLSAGGDLAFQSAGTLNAGLEYALEKNYFLRAGYVFELQNNQMEGLQGLDFGAGLRFGQFQFDYSFSFEGDLGNIQRFSLSLFFPQLARPAAVLSRTPEMLWSVPPGAPEPGLGAAPPVPAFNSGPVTQPVLLRFRITSGGNATSQQLFDQAEKKLKLGLKEEAMDLYLKAVEKDPHFEPAWNRLGRLYFDKSLESYRKVLELDPNNELLREWLNHFPSQDN